MYRLTNCDILSFTLRIYSLVLENFISIYPIISTFKRGWRIHNCNHIEPKINHEYNLSERLGILTNLFMFGFLYIKFGDYPSPESLIN